MDQILNRRNNGTLGAPIAHAWCPNCFSRWKQLQKLESPGMTPLEVGMNLNLIEEEYPGKVTGEFTDSDAARLAMEALVKGAALSRDNIKIIQPDDVASLSRKIEPDSHGIARTLVKTHVVLGVGGLGLGFVISVLLVLFGPPLTASSPILTITSITTIGTFAGLLIAGFISIRPDHDPLIAKARQSQRKGNWTVVAHTADAEENARAREVMQHTGALASRHSL